MFNLILLIIYKILLDIIYIVDIAPYYWGVNGLSFTYNTFFYFGSWMIFIISSILYLNLIKLDWSEYSPSNYIYLFIYFLLSLE